MSCQCVLSFKRESMLFIYFEIHREFKMNLHFYANEIEKICLLCLFCNDHIWVLWKDPNLFNYIKLQMDRTLLYCDKCGMEQ